jgi:hypothetical protein
MRLENSSYPTHRYAPLHASPVTHKEHEQIEILRILKWSALVDDFRTFLRGAA